MAMAQPEVLLDVDFSQPPEKWVAVNPPNDKMQGRLLEGWSDNSEWAEVWGRYDAMSEGGQGFIRMTLTQYKGGAMMMYHAPLPPVKTPSIYRLQVRGRSMEGDTQGRLGFAVREAAGPHKNLWIVEPNLGPEWRDYEWTFSLNPINCDSGFWINWSGKGSVDIAGVRLVRLDYNEYLRQLEKDMPAKSPRNLIRSSRFPLGMQSGWSMGRMVSDGDQMTVAPDVTVDGVKGSDWPALKITSNIAGGLYFEPLVLVRPTKQQVVSIYIKGRGTGKLSIGCDGRELAKSDFNVDSSQEWKRIEVPFTPNILGRIHSIQLVLNQPTRGLWVDALQAEEGEHAGPYVSMKTAEVALACPSDTDAAAARIQFADEPAEVEYCVTGAESGSVLKTEVFDLYGHERSLPDILLPLNGTSPVRGRLAYDPPVDRPYGQFRIECRVVKEDTDISPVNELIVTRIRRPRFWGIDAPQSYFGTHTFSNNRHLLMAKAVGINWVRLHDAGIEYVQWYSLEPQPGRWTFHDASINKYRGKHLSILGQLVTAPLWASRHPQDATLGYYDRFFMPRDYSLFGQYVKTVVGRYQGVIDAWDMWNEPWGAHFWIYDYNASEKRFIQSPDAAGDYARLMGTSYEQAKLASPNAIISGLNTYDTGRGTQWTNRLLAAGALPSCDVINYHQYILMRCGFPGDRAQQGYHEALGNMLDTPDFKSPKPVWMTEGNPISGRCKNGFYHYTLPKTDERENWMDNCDCQSRYMVSLLSCGVQKFFLYSMHVHGYFGIPHRDRTIVTSEGYPDSTAVAYAALAWNLDGMQPVTTLTLAPDVYAFLFQSTDGLRSAAVLATKRTDIPPFTPATAPDMQRQDVLGNPLPLNRPLGATIEYWVWNHPADALRELLTQHSESNPR
ncbi:MAG: hypothetical protein WC058_07295 [Phycisphaeraceae bacterium]